VPAGSPGSLGDPNRIQLSPLLRSGGHVPGSSTSPVMAHSGVPNPSSPGSAAAGNAPGGYPVIQLRSSSRAGYTSSSSGRDKDREREREDLRARDRERERDADRQGANGKKNPLSIGSIISDDGR